MTQQYDELKEFGYSQYWEANPQTKLTTNVGHKGHKLLKKNQAISLWICIMNILIFSVGQLLLFNDL